MGAKVNQYINILKRQTPALFLVGCIAFQVFWHFKLMFLVQGNVALYGQLVSQGLRPYVDFYLHYPPGIPYLTAWLATLHSHQLFPYQVIWITTHALTTVIIFALARRIFSNKPAIAYIAVAFYTVWHIFWAKNIFWFHTPIPVFASLALLLLTIQSRGALFLAGILLAAATLFKQPAIFFFLTLLASLFTPPIRTFIKQQAAPFILGYVLPLAVVVGVYHQQGELAQFIHHVVVEGVSTTNTNTYGTITFLTTGPPKNLVQFALYLFLIPYLKEVWPKLYKKEGRLHRVLLAQVAGGTLFLFPHVWVQYAVMALPFLSLVAAYVLVVKRTFLLFSIVSLATLVPLLGSFGTYYQKERASDTSYKPVVEWIKSNTFASERIFVCCTEPEMYWYSQRIPASRYTEYNGPMLATIDLNREIIEDLEKHQPRIVVEFADNEWERFNIVYLPKVVDYIHEKYSLQLEILPKVYIFERKPD